MISVTVATCFVVFIGPGNSSLLYYAAKASDSVQARPRNGRYNVHVARTRFGTATIGIYAGLRRSAGSQQQFGWAQKSSLSDICRLRGPPVWNRGVRPVVTLSTGVLASIAVETPNKLFGDRGERKIPSEPDGSAKLG